MKLQKLSFLILLAVITGSCASDKESLPTPPTGPGYDSVTSIGDNEMGVEYQYAPGVMHLDQGYQPYIIGTEQDSIIVFSADAPEEVIPQPGTIVASMANETFPMGLGNKVVRVTKTPAGIKCLTTLAPLTEVFSHLKWNIEKVVTDKMTGFVDKDGNPVEHSWVYYDENNDTIMEIDQERSRELGTVGKDNLISLPIKIKPKGGMSFDGSLNLGVLFHCSGDISENSFETWIKPIISFKGDIDVGLKYDKNIFQDMVEWPLPHLPKVPLGSIVCGPIVLQPYVTIENYVDFAASGTMKIKLEKAISAKIGYSQQLGAYVLPESSPGNLVKGISLSGNISLGMRCEFDLGCGLYTRNQALELVPYFKHTISADLPLMESETEGLSANQNISYDVKAGAKGRIVIDYGPGLMLSPELKFAETEVFRHEWPLIGELNYNTRKFGRIEQQSEQVYMGSYSATGGLLSMFDHNMQLGMRIYQDGKIIEEYDGEGRNLRYDRDIEFYKDGIKCIKEGEKYIIVPTVKIGAQKLNFGGWPYQAVEPNAKIDSIKLDKGEFGIFEHNGKDYEYKTSIYVYTTIVGSDNWALWGINCYDFEDNRQHTVKYKTGDGQYKEKWTAWTHDGVFATEKTPFSQDWAGEWTYYDPVYWEYNYWDYLSQPTPARVRGRKPKLEHMELQETYYRPNSHSPWRPIETYH